MSETFVNQSFGAGQAATGVLLANTFTGASIASGVSTITINGNVDLPGSPVTVNANLVGLAGAGLQGTYVGFSQPQGVAEPVYIFSVSPGGLSTPVSVAVSAGQLSPISLLAPVNTTGTISAPDSPTIVCFASGTRICTMGGEVAVEALRVGDQVVTTSGEPRPIRWIGSQTIDCRSHPNRGAVLPVRITKGALGKGQPTRDLWVSPRHGLCLDLLGEVLVPADSLINGATITQESVETVTYWHVELDSHDLLIAEGVAAESYLDIGNRGFFDGAAVGPDEEVPGGRATRAQCCRPFAEGDSSIVAFARERLRARAIALGWTAQPDPLAGLHALVDGQVIVPDADGTALSLRLPAGCGDVWLKSRTTVPALVGESGDRRRLGINLRGLTIEDSIAARRVVQLDDARLKEGFHPVQGKGEASYRWTRGDALLPASLWAGCTGSLTLRLELGGERLLRWHAPDAASSAADTDAGVSVAAPRLQLVEAA